jgi:hypothetical protein
MRFSSTFVGATLSALLVAACGSTVLVTDGEGGSGGSVNVATSGKSTGASSSTKATNGSNVATTNVSNGSGVTSVASGMFYCDEIAICEGDGVNWYSGCSECAAFGQNPPALDGGACGSEYFTCFGNGGSCASSPVPECCGIFECIDACDTNGNGLLDRPDEVDCFCVNDGAECVPNQPPGTCLGDYQDGLEAAIQWDTCLRKEVCPNSCGF